MTARRVWPDKDNQWPSYPPVKYNGWTLFPWPRWKEDAEGYFEDLKNLESREDDIFLCTVQKAVSFSEGPARPSMSSVMVPTGETYFSVNSCFAYRMKTIADREKRLFLALTFSSFSYTKDSTDFTSRPGSHWVHEIVSMLVDQTTKYNSRNLALDDIHVDTMTDFDRIEKETKRRILHTHLPFQFLPKQHLEKNAKVIFANRNPKDRHVSQYNFFKKMVGTPPDYSWEQYWDEMVRKDTFMTGWFNYTREMVEAVENNPENVTMVMFEDLKLHPEREIARLAKFLGVPYDDNFVSEIADKCSFTKLKNHKLDGTAEYAKNYESTLFRKGTIGDWKNWFSVKQNEEFDKIYAKEMKGVKIDFTFDLPELIR